MSIKKRILFFAFVLLFIGSYVMLAYAPAASLGSGYAITSNYEGVPVPLGTTVEVTAMTTNLSITHVTFLWKYDENIEFTDPNVPVVDDTYEGTPIKKATSTYEPDILGEWGVQALFQNGPGGKTVQSVEDVYAIKARSFFATPEIPILGTMGASIAMLLGLGYKMRRKPQK
jgi:hypothetical protein